jgi:preprotein translocase subunit SecG
MMFGVRRTSDFLIKLTSVLAAIFLLFSLVTNIIINKSGGNVESIIQQNGQQFPSQQVPTDMAPIQQEQQQNTQQNQQPQNQNQQNPDQKPK